MISTSNAVKSKLWGLAALLFLIAGVLLIVYPKWNHYKEYQRELELLTEWDSLSTMMTATAGQTTDSPADQEQKSGTLAFKPQVIDGLHVYGAIHIDKIDLREPIVEGATQESLKVGSGIVVPGRMPGEVGNFVLASHRSQSFGRHYNRLDELEIGDTIELESMDQTFTYAVESKFIVTPDDLSVLDQNKSEKELTLITCEPIDTATHRLIIKATMQQSDQLQR